MSERAFAGTAFECLKRISQSERFLERLGRIVARRKLEEIIRPSYPNTGNDRQPNPLGRMLWVRAVQDVHNPSSPGKEGVLYDNQAMRRFCGFSLDAPKLDEITVLNFPHRLEEIGLAAESFQRIANFLAELGVALSKGTNVEGPSATTSME